MMACQAVAQTRQAVTNHVGVGRGGQTEEALLALHSAGARLLEIVEQLVRVRQVEIKRRHELSNLLWARSQRVIERALVPGEGLFRGGLVTCHEVCGYGRVVVVSPNLPGLLEQ